MARYTKAQFESDIDSLNEKMKRAGIDRVYVPGYRYGYAAVDYGSKQQTDEHYVQGTVCAGGTKREMIAKAREDALNYV